jgi:molybdopterin-guanine dinucleotide biosynthesis protein A
MRAAGFVLVGGRSSRMGRDKARLPVRSHLLVEDVAAKVAKIAGNVALVGDPAKYSDLPFECIPDLHPGFGPLSGIEAALAAQKAECNLITACDLPDLAPEWLECLLAAARRSSRLCVAAQDADGFLHPLCAVYRGACLPFVQDALSARRLKLLHLLDTLDALAVKIPAPLRNVNTPEDWRLWQAV